MLITIENAIIFLIVGTILYIIGKNLSIEPALNRILWIVGLVFLAIGFILLIAWTIMLLV